MIQTTKINVVVLIACLLVAFMVMPLVATAQEATLTTAVPSNHILNLDIDGKGTVTVNGIECSKSKDITLQRHSEPSIQVQAARGYYIKSVTYNGENVTHLFNSGKWTMPKVESDVTLFVVFVRDSGNPLTGDPTNITILVTLLILSLLGIVALVLYWHRHHPHQ